MIIETLDKKIEKNMSTRIFTRNINEGTLFTWEEINRFGLIRDAPYFKGTGIIYRYPNSRWRSFVVNEVQKNGRKEYEVVRILNSGT